MKTTGVIRKLDELGRITLPIELRRSLNLDVKNSGFNIKKIFLDKSYLFL